MGRGMGGATRGGGAVGGGSKNKTVSETSKTTGPIMMKKGGAVNQHKRMAMGMMGGGMVRGYKKGGKVRKMRMGGSCD